LLQASLGYTSEKNFLPRGVKAASVGSPKESPDRGLSRA
jgi:hypothetical protein